jgi:hypothetical protein
MPFGLINAPASFQRMVNKVLVPFIDDFTLCYLDDIIIYSKSELEDIEHITKVLKVLEDNNLIVKLEKSEFHINKNIFLRYEIIPNGISIDPERVSDIWIWSTPKKIKDLQSFLGMVNYSRIFIENLSEIALPLTKLTRKSNYWKWKENTQFAFDYLKLKLTTAPTLKYADPELQYFLQTDASNFALRAVLLQYSHPIAYYSKKLIYAEINYEIYDIELLAIVRSLDHWRHYLIASYHPIVIDTDYRNLEYFSKKQILNADMLDGTKLYLNLTLN